MNQKQAIKELDQIENQLTHWGVNKENREDNENEEFQQILLRMERLLKSMRGWLNGNR